MTLFKILNWIATLLLLTILFFSPLDVYGFISSGEVKGIAFKIYAPSWIWQKNDINILGFFENKSGLPAELSIRLEIPAESTDVFPYSGPVTKAIHLSPGKEIREAFVGIQARERSRLGISNLDIWLKTGDELVKIEYPVKVIRGPVVGRGIMPVILPVGIALFWCGLVALIVSRFGSKGAWKVSSPSWKDHWV